jgi:uncharacterized protein YggT (Ycf19 family)
MFIMQQAVQSTPPVVDPNAPVSGADRAVRIVYLVFGVIEALIAIRVVLKLLGANPDAGFTSLIYNVTQPFVAFFQGVFPDTASHGSVLEISSLLAILVYALLAFGIATVVRATARRRAPGAPVA